MRERNGKVGSRTMVDAANEAAPSVPGRQTLVQQSIVPAPADEPPARTEAAEPAGPTPQLPSYASIQRMFANKVQAKGAAGHGAPDVHAAAAEGISAPSSQLPHLDQIQRSFGKHDVGHVQAHVGGAAATGAEAMGAEAFATGDHIAFAGAPSLHIAAHEAAHVVQQRGGVQLAGGVGQIGDTYELHADAVADKVVRGESAEALLDQHAGVVSGERGSGRHAVQHQPAKPEAGAAKAAEVAFNSTHVYSTAPEAAKKRKIDEQIMGGDFTKGDVIDMHSEAYLKQLISLASKGATTVKTEARGLQFFIIKGGAEGFLPVSAKGTDASNVTSGGVTTGNEAGTVMRFDNNDLIAAFDAKGVLVSSALLQRPLSIKNPDIWTERTANKIYDAWDDQSVSLYRNTNFDIKYYGLQVNDKLGLYASGKVRIDLHKQEDTNGCIFIVDPNTPPTSNPALSSFEPKFITDVMSKIGNKRSNIGNMHMVDVQ